jgi:methyl-accepting chemotaxis protein
MGRTSQSSEAIRSQLGDAAEVMVRVRREMQTIVASIQDLSRRNLQIGEIIESVGDVANQTQLLAVNAGIEAAKAGDVGRGFSVVAAEMKALADQTKKASQRIRRIVAEIQQAAAETARVVDAGQGRLQDAVQPVSDVMPLVEQLTIEVDESNRSLRQIIAIVSQQVGGISQITEAMKTIQGAVQHGLDQNLELERGAESLDRLGGQLRAAVAEYQI